MRIGISYKLPSILLFFLVIIPSSSPTPFKLSYLKVSSHRRVVHSYVALILFTTFIPLCKYSTSHPCVLLCKEHVQAPPSVATYDSCRVLVVDTTAILYWSHSTTCPGRVCLLARARARSMERLHGPRCKRNVQLVPHVHSAEYLCMCSVSASGGNIKQQVIQEDRTTPAKVEHVVCTVYLQKNTQSKKLLASD